MKKIVPTLVTALAVGAAAFAWWDTSAYRKAVAAFAETYSVEQAASKNRMWRDEIQEIMDCHKRQVNNQLSAEGRACLLASMPKIKGWQAAFAASITTSSWLLRHPDDMQLQHAALVAIDNARSTLIKEKPEMDAIQSIAEARDKSIILRLYGAKYRGPDLFVSTAERLNKVEYSVRLPDVAQNHREYLRTALVGITTH